MGEPAPGTVAAIDCGTNTIKLLIGDLPDVAVRESRMVRLGQGVDATGRLADEALERAFAAIDEYAVLLAEHGVPPDRVRFCATSATRDAANGDVFADGVEQRLGVRPEVVTGEEEARLAYDGAIRNLATPPATPTLVIDVGGGSTELILGDADGPRAAYSMDVGSVRMTERHLRSDPPTAAELAECVADIESALDECPVDPADAAAVVGVAGTVLTVGAGVLDLPSYDPERTDQARIPVEAVHEHVAALARMTTAERLALPWMHPGRADVIHGGALVVSRVLRRTRLPMMTLSEADILDGIAWSLVD
ncbi:MAG TPA: Ppx/GppA phosphatase family protein [Nocardioides sp.]